MGLFPLAAALVSAVLSASLLARYRRQPAAHKLAWGVALALFATASFSAALGMMAGWTPATFRTYYLFGAVVNVPVLALGTVWLYLPRKAAGGVTGVISLACAWGVFAVMSAGVDPGPLASAGTIPAGSEVMPDGIRALSRYYSYAGSIVVLAGAVGSAISLARQPGERARRLAQGNGLIALGTLVVAIGSAFARQGQGSVFAVGLAAGVSLMYLGFVRTRAPGSAPAIAPGPAAADRAGG